MDIESVRTFLAVTESGSFSAAAHRLHVTQSTVSNRILVLEQVLGAALFSRGKKEAELTPSGQRFLRHSTGLMRIYEQARHEIGLLSEFRESFVMRGRIALWDGFLTQWVAVTRASYPDIALRLEVGFESDTMQMLLQGTIDMGVVYTPDFRFGLKSEYLFEDELVLVTTNPDRVWPDPKYIHMDWGAEFQEEFLLLFPQFQAPAITTDAVWLVMQQIRQWGGSGFFPWRVVRGQIEAQQLWRVPNSPTIKIPAYAVHLVNRKDYAMQAALDSLRCVLQSEGVTMFEHG